jgi:thermitase
MLVASVIVGLAAFSFGAGSDDYRQGEILVKFKAGASANVAHSRIGAVVRQVIARIGVQRVQLPEGMSVDNAVAYYRNRSDVEFVEPNFARHLISTPNDPLFSQQYGMKRMKAELGWDLTTGKSSVVTAVIDTGIDLGHEDFVGKLVPGYDFSDNDSDPTAAGDHGVHTAGIVGAATNNGKGVAGVGYNTRVMPLKIFPNAFASTSADAIIYAADNGVKVISMSYGSSDPSTTEEAAANYAYSKGVVLVGGVGNDNVSAKFYPAAYAKVLSVGSTGATDQKSGFSNYGDWVSVAAPGEDILSTVTGGYAANSGTSMSCPQVAGMAALIFSFAAPGTTPLQVRTAIETTTDPVGNWLKNGRVNIRKALDMFNLASEDVAAATNVEVFAGTYSNGTLASVQTSDADRFLVNSLSGELGQVAGVVVTLGVAQSVSNLRTANLILEANGPLRAANQVFLWNYQANRFDFVRATSLTASGTNRTTIRLSTNLGPYVQNGEMKVLSRAISARRPLRGISGQPDPFTLGVNLLQLRTRPAQ